jgi:ribonuclease HI
MPDHIDENAINAFTDGSSYSNPRRGGMGMVFVVVDENGDEVQHDYCPPGYASATNNQMELQACVEALEFLASRYSPIDVSQYSKIIINTDSRYVVDNLKTAMFVWSRSKWTLRGGAPVANAQLWKKLLKRIGGAGKRVEINWVKGHKASQGNKASDKLAKQSAKGSLRDPLTQVSVRRKKTTSSVEIGSVRPSNQRLSVRIITCEYLRVQHVWKYKYEVMSPASPFFGKVDNAFSDLPLRDGHTYFVLMNDDAGNPRFRALIREIVKK